MAKFYCTRAWKSMQPLCRFVSQVIISDTLQKDLKAGGYIPVVSIPILQPVKRSVKRTLSVL